jgi:hypothetical protein
MPDASVQSTQEYIVRLWQRGLLSNAEAVHALAAHCTALSQQRATLRAACQVVEPIVALWVAAHPDCPAEQRAWTQLYTALADTRQ